MCVISVLGFLIFMSTCVYCFNDIGVIFMCLTTLSTILPVFVMCILYDQPLCPSLPCYLRVLCNQSMSSSPWIAMVYLIGVNVCSLGVSFF